MAGMELIQIRKNMSNLYVFIKLTFFIIHLINILFVIIGKKSPIGDYNSNLKKVDRRPKEPYFTWLKISRYKKEFISFSLLETITIKSYNELMFQEI